MYVCMYVCMYIYIYTRRYKCINSCSCVFLNRDLMHHVPLVRQGSCAMLPSSSSWRLRSEASERCRPRAARRGPTTMTSPCAVAGGAGLGGGRSCQELMLFLCARVNPPEHRLRDFRMVPYSKSRFLMRGISRPCLVSGWA